MFDGVPPVAKQENCLVQRTKIKNNINNNIKSLEQQFIDRCNNGHDINDKETLEKAVNLMSIFI